MNNNIYIYILQWVVVKIGTQKVNYRKFRNRKLFSPRFDAIIE